MKRSKCGAVLAAVLVTSVLTTAEVAAQGSRPGTGNGEVIQLRQPPARSWVGFAAVVRNMGRMVITEVEEGSPAAAAGFVVGDSIMAVDGRDAMVAPRPNFHQLSPGTEYVVRVRRGTGEVDLILVPGVPPGAAPRR
jgi:predicted metalloprotease with PDZ domain